MNHYTYKLWGPSLDMSEGVIDFYQGKNFGKRNVTIEEIK
jgi:hypothetical protein